MGRSFRFTQTNSVPFAGLDSTVIFSDGTATSHKILVIAATGLGPPPAQIQTQKAPFQQGASVIRTLYQPRTIVLECAIAVAGASSSGLAEVTTIKESISRALSTVGMGFLPETALSSSAYATFVGKLEYASDGVNYTRSIDVTPKTVEFPNAYYRDGFQKMRVVFECNDPFWYGPDQTSTMSQVSAGIAGTWNSIAWAPELGLFCAIGFASNNIMTSPDGITWTARTGSGSNDWYAIAWSPELGLFCVVANPASSAIQTSPDGIVWTSRTGAAASDWYSICWSPYLGIFCAIANTSNDIQTSPDGINWTLRSGVGVGGWIDICWSPELKIFCVIRLGSATIQTSTNGISWTSRTGAASLSWYSVAWSPELGLFCAVANGSSSIQTSPNGITWTLRTGAASGDWYDIAWSPELGLFCAIRTNSDDLQTSPDGINWTLRTGIASGAWYAIVWSSELGMFCATSSISGEYPEISYDGITWLRNSAATDWYLVTSNVGAVPTGFVIDIPILGGETGKLVAIGENFLWSGEGSPPSDHNLIFSTEGLKTGSVLVSTKFGSKIITQFNRSIMNKFLGGTFFNLYVSGSASNILYLRNTGTPAGAPTVTWRNRYTGV